MNCLLVDVRDVAKAHVNALANPKTDFKRFSIILSDLLMLNLDTAWWKESIHSKK